MQIREVDGRRILGVVMGVERVQGWGVDRGKDGGRSRNNQSHLLLIDPKDADVQSVSTCLVVGKGLWMIRV